MSDNYARVTPFPQTPYSQENQEKTSVSYSLSTTTRARAKKVETYYQECFGYPCPPRAVREIACWLREGMEADVIMEAMDEATMAPRPSWLYARAIINRCLAEGVLTIGAYYERQITWQRRRC